MKRKIRVLDKEAKKENFFNGFRGIVIEKDKLIGNFIVFNNSATKTEKIFCIAFEGDKFFEFLEIEDKEKVLLKLEKKLKETLKEKRKNVLLFKSIAVTKSVYDTYGKNDGFVFHLS